MVDDCGEGMKQKYRQYGINRIDPRKESHCKDGCFVLP